MTDFDIHAAMAILAETMPHYEQPLVDAMGAEGQTPFHILIATILTLRTKDTRSGRPSRAEYGGSCIGANSPGFWKRGTAASGAVYP